MNNTRKAYVFSKSTLLDVLHASIREVFDEYRLEARMDPTNRQLRLLMDNLLLSILSYRFFNRVRKVLPNKPMEYYYSVAKLLVHLNVEPSAHFIDEHWRDIRTGNVEFTGEQVLSVLASNIYSRFIELLPSSISELSNDDWNEWVIEHNSNSIGLTMIGDYRIRRYNELVRDGIITE